MYFDLISLLFTVSIMSSDIGECLGGNGTVTDSFKYQIYLKNKIFRDCSGIVMDEWHILTAAHCVYRNRPDDLAVYAGSTILVKGFVNIHEVREIHIHEDYNVSLASDLMKEPWPHHRANDIAILTLENPLILGAHIDKIQLPTLNIMPCPTVKCVISGWGRIHQVTINPYGVLFWTQVTIAPPLYCAVFEILIRENELCVTDLVGNMMVSELDTGGGLVCDGILVGVMTTFRSPIVTANVYAFLSFINKIQEKDQYLTSFFPSSFS